MKIDNLNYIRNLWVSILMIILVPQICFGESLPVTLYMVPGATYLWVGSLQEAKTLNEAMRPERSPGYCNPLIGLYGSCGLRYTSDWYVQTGSPTMNGQPEYLTRDYEMYNSDGAVVFSSAIFVSFGFFCSDDSGNISGPNTWATTTNSDGGTNYVRVCPSLAAPNPPEPKDCPKFNPIHISNGNKIQREMDFEGGGVDRLSYLRIYNSMRGRWVTNLSSFGVNMSTLRTRLLSGQSVEVPESFAKQVKINVTDHPVINVLDNPVVGVQYIGNVASPNEFILQRADGQMVVFGNPVSELVPPAYVNDRVSKLTDSQGAVLGYDVYNSAVGSIERFDVKGNLSNITFLTGRVHSFIYSDEFTPSAVASVNGKLIKVKDDFGREINFTYDKDGRVKTMTDPAGNMYSYFYNESSAIRLDNLAYREILTSVTFPDGARKIYWYNEQDKTSGTNLPHALTGVTDESGNRFSNYFYDASGRAVASEHAGGVDRGTVDYSQGDGVRTTIDPLGSLRSENFMLLNNAWVATGQQQPGGSGCVTAISHIEYYPNGEIASKDDFNGQRICYAYDGLNREISRVEGIPNTSICSEVLASNVSLPANARMTTTEWHPEWRLPTKVVAPGSITSSIYHGQPDPFNSNAVINCTSAANLPNGKSLPLLCKQVIQATLANGSADTTVPNTGTQYAYDANGKTLTAKDSLNRITGYSYYAATAFTGAAPSEVGVTKGDLQSITNPAGMVTTFDRYDRVGRLLQSTDPKGVVTQVSYGPRGWVNTVSTTAPGQSARTTTYTYDAMGQVRGVQSPDGSSVSYTYDAAHRLTRVSDARGNSVTYTLDNAGNRIGESMKDPQDVLLRVISRSFDALNRLQQVSGAVQ